MNENIQIQVWDLFVRLFHWLLVLLFIVAYVTGDDKGPLHRYTGYAVFGLVLARIFWGFYGTKHALFSDFICPPVKALNYLKELVLGKPKYYIGHNPAAGWMIISLLVFSVLVCASGYGAFIFKGNMKFSEIISTFSVVKNVYADDDEKEKHKERTDREERHDSSGKGHNEIDSDSVWSDVHEMSAQIMLILICLHVLGVAVSSKLHDKNLVKSIITGTKSMHSS